MEGGREKEQKRFFQNKLLPFYIFLQTKRKKCIFLGSGSVNKPVGSQFRKKNVK